MTDVALEHPAGRAGHPASPATDAEHDHALAESARALQPAPPSEGLAATTSYPMRNHPLRHILNNELHARPFAALMPPERVSHLAIHNGEDGAAEDHEHLVRLCERYGVPPPRPGVTHFSHDFQAFRVKWERHTEFVTYTFFRRGDVDQPFRAPVIELVARDWLDHLPGQVLSAAHVVVLPPAAAAPGREELARHFIVETLGGSVVAGGAASAFTDFQIHADGFSRVLVHSRNLGEHQAGRLIQRLLEKQTYRMMALLSLPLAREIAPEMARCERALGDASLGVARTGTAHEERALLERLTQVAASVERLSAATSYRFRATDAYHALVQRRIEELREERIPGLQTFGEFMDRRLLPAIRTCAAAAERLESISQRVTRASQLLHAGIGIALQEQNRDALRSVDGRARVQLIIQEMVEGLSVVAMAYYSVGLLSYLLKTLEPFQTGLDPEALAGAATPIVFGAVWIFLRRLRQKRLRHAHT